MSEQTRALIIGGGIGGLTTAIALRQAGIDAVIFERASDLRKIQVGGGFHLWPNAMRAIEQLQLTDRVEAVGTLVERTEFWTWRGQWLGAWPVGDVGRKLGVPNFGVSRADLHKRVLAEALGDGVVQVGTECTGFTQDATGVTARFADGREERGDLLIGADGVRSMIRTQLLGDSAPRYAGYTQWQAVIDSQGDGLALDVERVLMGPGMRFVTHHVGEGRLFWAGVTYGPETGTNVPSGWKATLLNRFRGWMAPIEDMISATDERAITWMDIYDRPPVERWGQGRVTLLGDAAHPMTTNLAQGACQAIEDAVVLARNLRESSDIPAALRTYETQRIPRTSSIVKQSSRLASLGRWKNPVACSARDRFMKIVFNGVALRQHERDMAYEF